MKRKFGDAPSNYVAGIGRGAIGFSTRSDIGPARESDPSTQTYAIRGELPGGGRGGRNVVNFGQAPAGYVTGAGRGVSGFGAPSETTGLGPPKPVTAEDKDSGDYSEANFDKFGGYGENLFSNTVYEADDKEADAIYAAIDRRMDSKRKAERDEIAASLAESNKSKHAIKLQFADAKRELASVTMSEWENLPEPSDYTRSNKNKVNEWTQRFTPVPDNIIASGYSKITTTATIDPTNGSQTSLPGTYTDFNQFGKARNQLTEMKLDQASGGKSGFTTVLDPKGYMTGLDTQSGAVDIADVAKVRSLLTSVTSSNPNHAPGWVAAARLEETAGKLVAARNIIAKGCDACPNSEDVWLEASRLNTPQNAKTILHRAVSNIPLSVKLWIRASSLETELPNKKAVLRRGLELIPASLKLWKEAIELETQDDARILLARAVECVPAPESLELWLALARLETYENAQRVLNEARTKIPTSHVIWLTAAKLEESNGHVDKIDRIVKKAVKSMETLNIMPSRTQWFSDAETSEKSGNPVTCQAILRATLGLGVEAEDRRATWLADADTFLSKNMIECARAVYSVLLTEFASSKSMWEKAVSVEKQYGNNETINALLQRAIESCPTSETLWLMAAKEKWLMGDIQGARALLKDANATLATSDKIWLAAVKLEFESGEIEMARTLLAQAREVAGTDRVWLKSATFEREVGCIVAADTIATEALKKYPDFYKLWLVAAQIKESNKDKDAAKALYSEGLKKCPNAPTLWVSATEFELTYSGLPKARTIIEQARVVLPHSPAIWLESVRIEAKNDNPIAAKSLMERALKEFCPTSGQLWAYAIELEPRPLRKAKIVDAIKKCNDDPYVFTVSALLFWADRKFDNVRKWFNRAVVANPDYGDAWAYYYKFELQYGSIEEQQAVFKRCIAAEPSHGELWQSISKAVGNMRLKVSDILPKLAALISNQ